MMMKTWMALTGALITHSAFAAQHVTLADGRQVQLDDDFTWHYVVESLVTNPSIAKSSVAKSSAVEASATQTIPKSPYASPTAIPVIPVVDHTVNSVITIGEPKPTLQLSDSGISVLLDAAQYDDGTLIIPTAITNQQASESVIQVKVTITVEDMQGQLLAQETISVWQSIKRMAATYLRPKQAAEGRPIKLTVPAAKQYQIRATVVEVSTR